MKPAPARGSLARGAVAITVATAVSRLTGFLRVVAVAAAMGTTYLANTYQSANTAPNLLFELVAAGILTSVFVPTFVDHIVKRRQEEGWKAADALTSVALVGLTLLALLLALAAPLVMRVFLVGVDEPAVREDALRVGTQMLRLFAPQVIFYGVGMIMTGALHAHRRFGMPAVAPIFNNLVVIAVYLGYMWLRRGRPPELSAVGPAEIWLLGAGTTAGVVAMTACLLPSLRRLGWSYRFRWEPSHPAVRRGARLGIWALGYAGGYQAGLIVVLILANRVEGGVAAYQWAYTFFYLPHALFGVPIFNVLFTAMAEHVAEGDPASIADRLRDGLGMLAFILLPVSAALLVLAPSLAALTLGFGAMTPEGSALVGRVLAGFALGLPAYSAFLVFTRAFYALGDTKLPALVNGATVVVSSVLAAVLFFSLGDSVMGLSIAHSFAFVAGALVLGALLVRRLGVSLSPALKGSLSRSLGGTLVAAAGMASVTAAVAPMTRLEHLGTIGLSAVVGGASYLAAMTVSRSPELRSLRELVSSLRRART